MTPLQVPGFDLHEAAPPLAVAIAGSQVTGSAERRHTAFLLLGEKEQRRLVHLGFDYVFSNEVFDGTAYCWVGVSGLNDVVRGTMIDWVLNLSEVNTKGLPYGFNEPAEGDFSEAGKYAREDTLFGLTCATFVLSCFLNFQLPLVDLSSWTVDRPGDAEFQGWALDLLRRRGVAEDRIGAQRAMIGRVARFRPEEVAAAANIFASQPVSFSDAARESNSILAQMREVGLL